MPLPSDIAEYLEDEGFGTVGTNIMIGDMPDSPDTCIAVNPGPGSPPDLVWEGEYPSCQIRVRNPTFLNAYSTAYEIMTTLHTLTYQTLEGTLYYYISAKNSPQPLGRDANKRFEFVVNFDVTKEIE